MENGQPLASFPDHCPQIFVACSMRWHGVSCDQFLAWVVFTPFNAPPPSSWSMVSVLQSVSCGNNVFRILGRAWVSPTVAWLHWQKLCVCMYMFVMCINEYSQLLSPQRSQLTMKVTVRWLSLLAAGDIPWYINSCVVLPDSYGKVIVILADFVWGLTLYQEHRVKTDWIFE